MSNPPPLGDWGQPPASATQAGSDTARPPTPSRPLPVPMGPGGPPPVAPTRRRNPVGALLFLAFLAFVIFVVLVAAIGLWVVSRSRPPILAVNEFVAALDEGRTDDAYRSMCSEALVELSAEEFADDMAAATRISDYSFLSTSTRTNGLTMVSGTVDIDGTPQAISFGLRQEGDEWRVCTYDPIR